MQQTELSSPRIAYGNCLPEATQKGSYARYEHAIRYDVDGMSFVETSHDFGEPQQSTLNPPSFDD